jgi:hypothetical protein
MKNFFMLGNPCLSFNMHPSKNDLLGSGKIEEVLNAKICYS